MNRYILLNFWRNLRHSWRTYLIGACVSGIAFGLCAGFFLVHRNVTLTTQLWASSVPVTVILDTALSGPAITDVEARAREMGAVDVTTILPEEGKRRVEAALGGSDLLAGFEENPLPPMLELRFSSTPGSSRLAAMQEWPGVVEVDDATMWSERFEGLTRMVDRIGGTLLLLLLGAGTGVAALSVRLVAASHQAETDIQRLVGASEAFIRGPYILAGAMLGLSGMALGIGGMAAVYGFTARLAPSEWPIPIHGVVFFHPIELIWMALSGALIGAVGAWLGLRRRVVSA